MKRLLKILSSNAIWFWTVGAIGVMVLAVVTGAVFWNSLKVDQNRQEIESDRSRSLEIIIAANAVETAMLERQRTMRGILISNKVENQSLIRDAGAEIKARHLQDLVVDDPTQKQRAMWLEDLVEGQSRRIERNFQDMRAGHKDLASDRVTSGEGDRAVSVAHQIAQEMVDAERDYLNKQRVAAANIARSAENYTYAIGFIGLLVIVVAGTSVTISLSASWSNRYLEIEKRLSDATRMSEERMRIAHEATGAGSWEIVRGETGWVWSPEMFRLYDRDPELGIPSIEEWRRLVHVDDHAICPWLNSDRALSQSFDATFRITTTSGAWRWIVSRGFAFQRDGMDRMVGLDVDITEQVSNREELARLNALLNREVMDSRRDKAMVFEATSDLMAVIMPDGTLLSANPAWGRVLGISAEEVIGQNISNLIADDGRWRNAGDAFTLEMVASDKSVRQVEWVIASGPEGRMVAAGRDVTVQRQVEARLRESESHVRQLQKIETIGELTGGVAHDFNNMLTPIFGYLEMLMRRHGDDPKSARMISTCMASADKAKVLVSKLLTFARRQHLEYQIADAGELVLGMSELVEKAVAGAGVDCRIEVEGIASKVRVDINQLEMVLMNLAVNARDAMPQGGRIHIAVRRALDDCAPVSASLKPGSYVVISVADTGCGMDSETLAKAVEPFYSTKGVGKGTGLGLSQAHGMAAQLGGALVLESTVGLGTVASIWLPEIDSGLSMPSFRDSSLGQQVTMERQRILLVDDDVAVRTSIEMMLSEMGHEVVACGSGDEGLRAFAADDHFNLLVTDYLMPNMTGTALINRVRELEPNMPAVIVSGYTTMAERDDLENSIRLAKPFTSMQLAEAVGRLVAVPVSLSLGDNVVHLSKKAAAG